MDSCIGRFFVLSYKLLATPLSSRVSITEFNMINALSFQRIETHNHMIVPAEPTAMSIR